MIWDIVFWLSLVFLVAVAVCRIFFAPKDKPAGKAGGKDAPEKGDNPFFSGWTWPTVALVLFALALVMRLYPDLLRPGWSDEERAEVEHFTEAIALYQQANEVVESGDLIREDWETVNALLQASKAEIEQVSDDVLDRIHPDLDTHVRDEFVPGLTVGTYGITYFTANYQKGSDTVEHHREDSLALGRTLLGQWVEWYEANKVEINERLN